MNGQEEQLSPEEIEVNDLLDKTFEDIDHINEQMERPYDSWGEPAPRYSPPGSVPRNQETPQQRLERLKSQKTQVSQQAKDKFRDITKNLSPEARKKIEKKAIGRIKGKLADNRSKRLQAERQQQKPLSRSQGVMMQLQEDFKERQKETKSQATHKPESANKTSDRTGRGGYKAFAADSIKESESNKTQGQDKKETEKPKSEKGNEPSSDKKNEAAKDFAQNREDATKSDKQIEKQNTEQSKEAEQPEVSQEFKENADTMGKEEPTFDNSMDEYANDDPPQHEPEMQVEYEPADD